MKALPWADGSTKLTWLKEDKVADSRITSIYNKSVAIIIEMPITVTVDETIQLTDGNWNGQPTTTPEADNVWPTQSVDIDLDLSEDLIWTGTLDLEVIGDFNANGEVLEVEIEDGGESETAVLFDNNYNNDEWFDGEATGPTNGTANPLIGAQPSQGNVTINGHQGGSNLNPFTEDDIDAIINDTAVFTSNASVTLSGDLGQFDGDAIITYSITEYPLSESGVDFAQIEMVLTATTDWSSDKAISNVVFYLDCGDEELIKVKIDNWSDLEQEYTSTGQLDFSAEAINALLADEFEFEEDCDFVGMTIKAGNNFEDGVPRNQTMGEGEIIFGNIEGDYGKLNKFDYVVEATDVIDDFLMA